MANEPVSSQPAPMTTERRDEVAARLVDRFSMWSGGAGLIPLPFVDVSVVAGVQLQMMRRLAEIYGVKFTDNLGKTVLASLMGSLIPATSGIGFASALKSVPLVGTAVSLVSMPILSFGATYLIGRVFMHHFATGGTLLDFSPPDYSEFIKEQVDKLKDRLDTPSGTPQAPAAGAQEQRTQRSKA